MTGLTDFVVEGPESLLVAVDAFNGTKLWQRKLPTWVRTYVAHKDALYCSTAAGGGKIEVIDARTGDVRTVLDPFPRAGTARWPLLAVYRGMLYSNTRETLYAIDLETGEVKWQTRQPGRPLCLGDNRVYVYEEGYVVAVDTADGKILWKTKASIFAPGKNLWALYGFYGSGVLCVELGSLVGIWSKDGSVLWRIEPPERGFHSYVIIGDRLWREQAHSITSFDVATGGEIKSDLEHYTYRCARVAGVGDWLLYSGGISANNIKTGESLFYIFSKTACRSLFPSAHGLTYAMPSNCMCGNTIKGYIGLANARGWKPGLCEDELSTRLEKGPAYGVISKTAIEADNWPCFRHDIEHSAVTASSVPFPLRQTWETEIRGTPTPPAVASGLVFVGSDANRMYCFDATDGTKKWSFITDGAVLATPTVHEDLLLVGATDGWVYCLRAASGELAWRFRAAPEVRKILMYDHLTSTWPVSGGVAVVEDVAYFCAGRLAPDGAYLYAADPRTGEILWKRNDLGFTPNRKQGWSRGGRHYIYTADEGKGIDSAPEGPGWEMPPGKRGKSDWDIVLISKHGPMIHHGNTMYAAERSKKGTPPLVPNRANPYLYPKGRSGAGTTVRKATTEEGPRNCNCRFNGIWSCLCI